MTQPFSLYGNSIRLSVFEKLNLMERETVQALCLQLEAKEKEIETLKSIKLADQQIQDTYSSEKNEVKG